MYDKCTSNSYIYIEVVHTVQNLCKSQTKLQFFCTYKQSTNFTKLMQLANWNCLFMSFVHTHNVQTIQILCKC